MHKLGGKHFFICQVKFTFITEVQLVSNLCVVLAANFRDYWFYGRLTRIGKFLRC
jgi:hypothetical protein